MKKFSFLAILLLFSSMLTAQVYMSKNCEITFFSETPIENIEAKNTAPKVVLNTATGDVQIRVPIINFRFEKKMMEEHFNENYMETDKFPTSEFKGKINEKVDYTKDGEYKVTVTGKLKIHGVEKERTIDGKITVKGQQLTVSTSFNVHLADHNIKIPTAVVKKIAEDVKVNMTSILEPYKKK